MPFDEGGGMPLPPPLAGIGGGGSRGTSDRKVLPNTAPPTYKPPVYRPPMIAGMTPPPATMGQGGGEQPYYGVYHGGNGGGGGQPVMPPNLFPGLNLPELYTTPFVNTFGGMPQYYTAARGGEDQAERDYYNLVNFWASRTGRNPTPDELNRLMLQFPSWRNLAGKTPQFGDLMGYASSVLRKPPTPPQLSYLYMGEM